MKPERNIVLITGASGRIGSAVIRRLSRRFSDVVGIDRKAPSPPPPGCTHIPVDLTSNDSLRDGLRILREHHGTHIASVVHLAAYYDFLGKPSPKYDEITVEGTRRLLRGLRAGGFEVEQFLFSNTMLVHKPGEPGEFITEDWPLGPTWAYLESKVRTEALIREERGAIPAAILRFAGVYDDICHSPPLAHQIQRIYEGQLAAHLYSGEFVPDANQLRVMAERDLASFELRNLLMTWSDVLSGILVIVFSVLSADAWRRNPWAQWANAFVGLWLLFAPLVFWTPLPEAYANGTLVGALVIALSVLIPMMPGMSMAGMMGKPDVPPGWAYTPSSWLQRMPIGVLALVGFLIARVLGAYQRGHAIRFVNIPFGAWLIAAPWLLDGIASPLALWNGVICGVLLIVLALPRGKIKDSYAGWDRFIV